MEIMHKKELQLDNFKELDSKKALSEKVYTMMKNDPAEVYRILTEPDYSMKSIN